MRKKWALIVFTIAFALCLGSHTEAAWALTIDTDENGMLAITIDNPNDLEKIADLNNKENIKTVQLNSGAGCNIPEKVFIGCTNLETVTTDNIRFIQSVGDSAFSGCSSLSNIDLSTATSIGDSAFSECSSLSKIDLSAATSIGDDAFSGLENLSSVTLCDYLEIIGERLFKDTA